MVTTGHELDGWMIQLGRQFDAPAKRLTTQYRHDARKRAVIGIAVASLAVTTVYLRRLEGQEDLAWARVAEAIGVA